MERFSLGLAKSAVEGTLVAVRSAIEEDRRLKVQFKNDLVFIIDEFQMMQSFLRGANAGERVAKNELVRTWVRRVRRLAFDVEDCVEFVVHLDKSSALDWLRRLAYHFICRTSLLPLDLAVAQIQELKARVVDVSQRNTRYSLLTNFDDVPAGSKPQAITPYAVADAPSNILNDVWEAAGEGHWTRDLKHLITSEGTRLQVISVWATTSTSPGPGGGGGGAAADEAAYVINKAYDDPEIRWEFKTRAWVKLMHPFDPDQFLESLLTQLYCNSFHQTNIRAVLGKNLKAEVAKWNDELMRQLRQQRYLVILEDVTAVAEWNAIRLYLPVTNNGSRIVVYTAQHIGLARLCTGEPYRLSELKRISDGQSLCAFSDKLSVRRSDLGELNWQITRGGVISLTHYDPAEDPILMHGIRTGYPYHIQMLYKYIMHKRKELDGLVEFKEQSWVNISSGNPWDMDMEAFSVGLFLGFQRRDFRASEIEAVGGQGHQAIVQRCRRYLRDDACLVVINDLESEYQWEKIKETFLSSGEPIHRGTSIIVIATDGRVAKHCVDDQQHRVFRIDKDVKDNKALNRFIKDYKCYGIGGKLDSRLFHDTEHLSYSKDGFKLVGRENEVSALERQLQVPGVISVWGPPGVGKSVIVKKVYYGEMHQDLFESFSFVDLPDRGPFDLTDFSWHLLLDFYTHDPRIKEKIVISLYKGQQDPIQACRRVLRRRKCLVVIDGLRSKAEWDKIRDKFLPPDDQPIKGCIVVIRKVARHSVAPDDDRVLVVNDLRVFRRLPLTELGPPVPFMCHLVGRAEETKWLIYEVRAGVNSLWGVAGVGKSALVRDYYRCGSQILRCRPIWVDVPDPFNLTEFSRRLLLGDHSNDLRAQESAAVAIMEGQGTVHACLQILRENRCLLVIDGLRSTQDWDLIRASFLSEHNDHVIIVVSNEARVATHCASRDKRRVLNVKGLEATHSLHLFRQIAWDDRKDQLTTEEREVSEAILAKCGGLPKVIVAIGEYASEKIVSEPHLDLRILSWMIHDNFMGKLETDSRFHSLRGLFCWMQSYFDACPDQLKPCIFYLSVFLNIGRRRMLRRWNAEGYSTDASSRRTTEDNAEMLFDQLVDLSIIQKQETPSSSRKMYQVNGFFLEYIKSRPMEDNLVFALEENCRPNTQRTIQHLAIMSSWDRDQIVFESMDLTRLRSLTVFGEWRSFFISADTKMRLLRVLDLEDTTSGVTDEVLEQIPKLLPRLKFLSLRGCQDITCVPDSFGGLKQMQTLDVRHTKIRMLPRSIIKLVKLQYLRAGTTNISLGEGHDNSASIYRQTAAAEGGVTSTNQAAEGDVVSTSRPAEGDDPSSSPPAEDDVASTSRPAEGDGAITSPRAEGDVASTSPPAEGDGASSSPPAEADGASTGRPAEGDVASTNQPGDGDVPSTYPPAEGDVASTSPPAEDDVVSTYPPAEGDATSSSPPAEGDGASTSRRAGATESDVASTSQQAAAGASTSQLVADKARTSPTVASWSRRARDLVVSCRKKLLRRPQHDDGSVGVVPAAVDGIGKLTALHTFGVVNVSSGAGGKAILEELKKLPQLRKLGVSGINRKNWHNFCSAISGHRYLESLSVWFDDEPQQGLCFSDISKPPETLKSLKLYGGNVHVPSLWMKQLHNLSKAHLEDVELTISTQEDIDSLVELPCPDMFRHVCVKPVRDCELHFGWSGIRLSKILFEAAKVLKIDCGTYKSKIVFASLIPGYVEVLVVHCSTAESSLELSGLDNLRELKEVWLKGSCSEAAKQHLQQKLDEIPSHRRPVLKLDGEQTHQ